MRVEVSVDDLLANAEIERAKEVAYSKVRERFDEENVLNLLRVLATLRDAKSMRKVFRRWREEHGKFPQSFKEVLALYYLITLQIDRLLPILPETPEHVAFWILTTLGYTEEAKRYDLSKPARMATVRLLEGYDYQPPQDIPPLEKLFFTFFNTKRFIVGGEINRAMAYLNEALALSLKQGALPIALNAMVLRGAFQMNSGDIEIARYVSQNLDDRMGLAVAQIYSGLVEGKVPTLEIPERFPILRAMYDYLRYVVRREGVFKPYEGIRSVYNTWWYLDKIRNGRLYITFAGRLRVVEGNRVMRLPQKQLLCVAFVKVGGRDLLNRYAPILFPGSKNPQRRALENLSRASDLRFAPSDLYMTLRFGNFLRDEEERWAVVLKEEARRLLSG
ncbi:MAG: hypothetical protein GXO29_04905 [Thermotogae bacterium]|nr:hypothetical protein [Thermotogota bacterium]